MSGQRAAGRTDGRTSASREGGMGGQTPPSRGTSAAHAPAHGQVLGSPHLDFADPPSCKDPRGHCRWCHLGSPPAAQSWACHGPRLSCSATVRPPWGSPLPASSRGSLQSQAGGRRPVAPRPMSLAPCAFCSQGPKRYVSTLTPLQPDICTCPGPSGHQRAGPPLGPSRVSPAAYMK